MHPGCTRPGPCRERNSNAKWKKQMTGPETEPFELMYFKLYQSQVPVEWIVRSKRRP